MMISPTDVITIFSSTGALFSMNSKNESSVSAPEKPKNLNMRRQSKLNSRRELFRCSQMFGEECSLAEQAYKEKRVNFSH